MAIDDKARRLVDHLQTVLEEAERVDRRNRAARARLSRQEIRVLRALGRRDGCLMRGIADAICLSLSSATGLIDRLVEKKLVRRARDGGDRRCVQVELTEEGRALNEEALAGPMEFARGLLRGLNAEEQESLLAFFRGIAERIKSEKATA